MSGMLGVDLKYVYNQKIKMEYINAKDLYKLDNATLRIAGLPKGNATIIIFNLLGKQVMNTSFTTNGVQDIAIPKFAKGVYIVQLKTASGQLNKKIILE